MAIISNASATMDFLDKVIPLTRLWQMLDANNVLAKSMFEYILAEIAMICILKFVEDDVFFLFIFF